MRYVSKLLLRFRSLLRKRAVETELDEELRYHLERQIEENIRTGMTPEEAYRAARLEFGGVEEFKEVCRDQRGVAWIETIWQDVRYGARMLAKAKGFTAVAVLSLALGIGATTTIFSVIDAVVLRPLAYEEPERLVIGYREEGWGPASLSVGRCHQWKEQSMLLERVAILEAQPWELASVPIEGEGNVLSIQRVDVDTFPLLGVQPVLGRTFLPEDQHTTAAIISYRFWQERFGGDPNVLGVQLAPDWDTDTGGAVVVGVMPPGFWLRIWPSFFENDPRNVDIWLLYDPRRDPPGTRRYAPVARLKPGVTVEQARAEFHAIAAQMDGEPPGWLRPCREDCTIEPLTKYVAEGNRAFPSSHLYLFWAAAAFVLLIGCANVASLLLSRGLAREKEMANRAALGAGRGRLIRQLLTESTFLAVLGGLLGTAIALAGARLFVILAPAYFGLGDEVSISIWVLGFSLGTALATGIVFGLIPALRASRPNLTEALAEGGRSTPVSSHHRARGALVVAEVAIAVVLLAAAGLLLNSLVRLLRVEPGFQAGNVLTAKFQLSGPKYRSFESSGDEVVATHIAPAADAFHEELLEGVGALPGVVSASLTFRMPTTNCHTKPYTVPGRPPAPDGKDTYACFLPISPDFFNTLGIPLVKGRAFSIDDTAESPWVAIISQGMAEEVFPDEEPLGKFIQLKMRNYITRADFMERPRRIVGVVGDVRQSMVKRDSPYNAIYVPYNQILRSWPGKDDWTALYKGLIIRTQSDPASYIPAVRRVFAGVDQEQALVEFMTMEDRLAATTGTERFWANLLGIFASLAVFLAAVGLYGVISCTVALRTHEFGIRRALGAQTGDILRRVLSAGLVLTLIGLAIGLAGSLGLTQLIKSQLYGITPTDTLTYAAGALILLVVALLASYIPARRATKVDPMTALRYE